MNTVFTYGSLMFDPVWSHVVRGHYASAPARAIGVRRGAVVNEAYPGCVREPEASTAGRVYFNVSAADMARLDTFEGEHYWREAVLVRDDRGQTHAAWIYMYRLTAGLSATDWSPEWFEREGMAKFLASYTPTRLPVG
jgi:gamma-glutamylcyclotransferase (GGCT)/AIG2-like uncharacterized protein YtfP